jgi:hypothetical protein
MDTETNPTHLQPSTIVFPGKTSVILNKPIKNTMDLASLEFVITLATIKTWGKNGHALIQFPTYYQATIGKGIKCTLKKATFKEDLYCQLAWDWTLEVWGPRTVSIENGKEFSLFIQGVIMNNPS